MKLTSGMFISLALLGGLVFTALAEIAQYMHQLEPLFKALAGGK